MLTPEEREKATWTWVPAINVLVDNESPAGAWLVNRTVELVPIYAVSAEPISGARPKAVCLERTKGTN